MPQVQFVRVGRKRKQGIRRHPGGQPVDERINVAAIAMSHPDRQGLPKEKRCDERASTFIGRIHLIGHLSDEQLEAGRLYARDVSRYQQAVGAPKPNAAAINLMGGGGGIVIYTREEIKDRTQRYNDAFNAVSEKGNRCARAVSRVAIYEEGLPEGTELIHLTCGLDALVNHYGLTTRRKSVHYINRR